MTSSEHDRRRARRAARRDNARIRAQYWTIPFRWRHLKELFTPTTIILLALIVFFATVAIRGES